MSYAERRLRKHRRPLTGVQLKLLIIRDTRFCDRWAIPEERAHLWDRYPDHTMRLPG